MLRYLRSGCSRNRRLYSSIVKPYYITTPIFYVNAKPHIGHLYTLVLADVYRRYNLFCGREVYMLTGTDEHGIKIQNAAKNANKSPQSFCDEVSETFRDLPAKANVEYDQFIRTSDPKHKNAVAHFWQVLQQRGYIYKAIHKGWYSISDETFFPEAATEMRYDPRTKTTRRCSIETGNVLSWTEEENYHFRLSSFKDQLLQHYEQQRSFVLPQHQYDTIVKHIREDLHDLSISRPSSRLSWGIQVPNDASQTIYVWLDALINYISAAGYPGAMPSWPADCHMIGKDITRFHCIYWPSFLLAAELPLPRQIVSHAHWTVDNTKISKSLGNVVDPWSALERLGIDSLRYYLMRDGRLENDGNFDEMHVLLRHNHELVNGLGNLVARIGGKGFPLHEVLSNPPTIVDGDCLAVHLKANDIIALYHKEMEAYQVFKALQHVVQLISIANTLMQQKAPWNKDCDASLRHQTLYVCAECARLASLMLSPIMPDSASKLLDRLGVSTTSRLGKALEFGQDVHYRPKQGRVDHVFNSIDPGTHPARHKLLDAHESQYLNDDFASVSPRP